MDRLLSLDWTEIQFVLIKLALSFLLALPAGWDRERKTVLMGLRTFPIVALASCGYILVAAEFATGNEQAQARVLQGLVAGMGFIGGGAILKGEDGVRGTATAASLWATGVIGAAVAFGRLEIALATSLVLYGVLRFMTRVKDAVGEEEGDDYAS